MKKLLFAGITLTLALALVVPAYARDHRDEGGVKIENEHANVRTGVLTVSNSGLNAIVAVGHRAEVEHAYIGTGNTEAWATVKNNVNSTKVNTCGNCRGLKVEVENERADVKTGALSVSNSGVNLILGLGGEVEHAAIRTGSAYSDGFVENVVNSTVVR